MEVNKPLITKKFLNTRSLKSRLLWLLDRTLLWVTAAIISVTLAAWSNSADAAPTKRDMVSYAAAMEWQYNLPLGMVRGVCEQESRWRNVGGAHGEIGVCQILPSTVLSIDPMFERRQASELRVKYGARGELVLEIQSALASKDLYHGKLDGIWGPKTHAAVIAFQQSARIRVDGIVGPQTWGKLFPKQELPINTVEQMLWKPIRNIEWAARVLAECRTRVGNDVSLMLGCYNGGANHPILRYITQTRARMVNAGHSPPQPITRNHGTLLMNYDAGKYLTHQEFVRDFNLVGAWDGSAAWAYSRAQAMDRRRYAWQRR